MLHSELVSVSECLNSNYGIKVFNIVKSFRQFCAQYRLPFMVSVLFIAWTNHTVTT